MDDTRNSFLLVGAILSALAALVHAGCIVFGASWYRFFGAGERMAQLASAGSWYPAVVTSIIVVVLATWSLYALSGGGFMPRLPFLRLVLCLVTAVYLLRGVAVFVLVELSLGRSSTFWWWSSAICFVVGVVHFVGLRQIWRRL